MKGGTRIAIGVGVGYVLGRTRKMRFALSLAGAAMARRSTGTPAELLERGTSLLKSSSALTELTDTVRGELMDAARSAAVTAASNRIDALNERLQQGATLVSDADRHRGRDTDSDEPETGAGPRRETGPASPSGHGDSPDEDEHGADRHDEERARSRRATGSRSGGPVTARTRRAGSRTSNRGAGSADRAPVSSSARRRASASVDADDDAPVRRTRR